MYWQHRLHRFSVNDDDVSMDRLRSNPEFADKFNIIVVSIYKKVLDNLVALGRFIPLTDRLPQNVADANRENMLLLQIRDALDFLPQAHWVYQKVYGTQEDTDMIEQLTNRAEDCLRDWRLPFRLCLDAVEPDDLMPEEEEERGWCFVIQRWYNQRWIDFAFT